LRIDPLKNSSVFSADAPHLITGLATSNGGQFQEGLYASEVTYFPGGFVETFDEFGNRSAFSTFDPTILSDVIFGSSTFGNTNLFVANSVNSPNGEIYQVDPAGTYSLFTNLPEGPIALAMTHDNSAFGNYLFATTHTGNIYRINSNGDFSTFYSLNHHLIGSTGNLAFDPGTDSLYIADREKLLRFESGSNTPTEIFAFVPLPAAI
jgi:sugar lactone lactonase YvrE